MEMQNSESTGIQGELWYKKERPKETKTDPEKLKKGKTIREQKATLKIL